MIRRFLEGLGRTKSDYLDKYVDATDRELKYDFLPSMLEIIEKPENILSNIIIYLCLGLIITTVIWAAIAKVDIVVTASGNVMPEGNLVSIINAYGGEVTDIGAFEGENVEKGQELISLDSDSEEATLEEYEYELSIIECQKEVYEAIRDYEDAENNEIPIEEKNFGVESYRYGANKQVADSIIAEERLFLINCEAYDIQRDKSDNKKSVDNQKEAFILEHEMTILKNINSLEVKVKETTKNIEDTQKVIEDKKVKAPVSGVVSNLSVNAVGQILPSGQNLCYIIPENADTRFVAYVGSADIETIEIGDEVQVKLAALDNTDYEIVTGEVVRIGDIAMNVENRGAVYKVEIAIDDIPKDLMKVGTEGSCDIITGRRSVLRYFTEPFVNGLKDSLHER